MDWVMPMARHRRLKLSLVYWQPWSPLSRIRLNSDYPVILSGVRDWRVDVGFWVVDMSSAWRSHPEADVVSGVGFGGVHQGSGGSCQVSPVIGLCRSQRQRLWAAWALTPSARPISAHVAPAATAKTIAVWRSASSPAMRPVNDVTQSNGDRAAINPR
jgi:hypothetical protein